MLKTLAKPFPKLRRPLVAIVNRMQDLLRLA
ncbi:hypothetical protein BH10PSE7_BH10PSE7_39300 [soil metagenome]